MKEWKQRNKQLQNYYKDYLTAINQEEKVFALENIQKELYWGPFMCICCEKKIPLIHIIDRGIDKETKECINLIDLVAKGDYLFTFE